MQHPQRRPRCCQPCARQRRAARRADRAGAGRGSAVHRVILRARSRSVEGADGGLGGSEEGAVGDESARRPRSRGRGSGPGRARAHRARTAATTAAGRRRRLQRRAQVERAGGGEHLDREHPGERRRPTRRSLRAAAQPIDTWSSCIAERRDRVDAGRHRQPLELGDDRGLRCTARSCGRSRRRGRRRGTAAGRAMRAGSSIRSVRRSLIDARSATRSPGSPARRRRARRGSCRWTRPGRRRATTGLSIGRGELAAATSAACVEGVAGRAGTCGAQRSEYASCTRVSPCRGATPRSRTRRAARAGSAADAAWPGCGRSACRSAANTRSVPSSASTLIAAAMSAIVEQPAQVVAARAAACRACRRCR